jgi:tetratricopeptide (TPR) repeat protein
MNTNLRIGFILTACFAISCVIAQASTRVFNPSSSEAPTPTPGGPDFKGVVKVEDLYNQGLAATQAGDYSKALSCFDQANRIEPDNPDILNMLAHTQRKLDKGDDVMMDVAMENYWKALRIKPDFPEAREYMGETYLLVLLEQIEKLKSYGPQGKEQLDSLTKSFLDAAEKLKAEKKE